MLQSSLGLMQIQVQHPAAKSMIEVSRTQDEEVGDGTTSVIILGKDCLISMILLLERTFYLAGEMLSVAEVFLEQQMHPTVIISAYRQALDDIVTIIKDKIRYKYGSMMGYYHFLCFQC